MMITAADGARRWLDCCNVEGKECRTRRSELALALVVALARGGGFEGRVGARCGKMWSMEANGERMINPKASVPSENG